MSLPTAPAKDHRVHLMYAFQCDPAAAEAALPKVTLANAAPPNWLHPDRLDTGTPPLRQRLIWDWTKWDVSPALHPFVRSVLNSYSGQPVPEDPLCLTLSAEGLNLVAGRYRRPSPRTAEEGKSERDKDGLVLALPRQHDLPEAVLNEAPWLIRGPGETGAPGARVALDSVRLHLFRTGVGLIVVGLRLAGQVSGGSPIAAGALVTALPLLTHERRDPCLGWADRWTDQAGRFSLRDILTRLIAPAGCAPGHWDRIYSYCALVYDTPVRPDEARDIAFRLSRHYSMRYRPAPDLPGTEFVAPFENVLHAASREGGCTLINGTADASGTQAELLSTWTTQSHAHVYLPLQVAAMHELVALMEMAQASTRRAPAAPLDTKPLRELSARFLLFRLHYRFARVSNITMHDQFFEATARALGLDEISDKIARDLLAIERRLTEEERETAHRAREEAQQAALAAREAHERSREKDREAARLAREETEKRYAVWAGLSSGGLAYLTISAVAEHALKFMQAVESSHVSWHAGAELLGQVLALAGGGLGFRYATRHQRHGLSFAKEILEHEQTEVAIAANEARPEGHS